MAYLFTGDHSHKDAYIDYGVHDELTILHDLSVGVWLRLLDTAVADDLIMSTSDANFSPFVLEMIHRAPYWGVACYHTHGGFGAMGVECVPGFIAPLLAWLPGQWRYFGFTRSYSAFTTWSYFGNRNALVDGQIGTTPAPPPPISPQAFLVGRSESVELGPVSLWTRQLTRIEHLQLSRCILPVSTDGLVLRSLMGLGAADIGPFHFANTFHSDSVYGPPAFVDDNPCAPVSQGQDYRLYNT